MTLYELELRSSLTYNTHNMKREMHIGVVVV